jgi:hypothetical protein
MSILFYFNQAKISLINAYIYFTNNVCGILFGPFCNLLRKILFSLSFSVSPIRIQTWELISSIKLEGSGLIMNLKNKIQRGKALRFSHSLELYSILTKKGFGPTRIGFNPITYAAQIIVHFFNFSFLTLRGKQKVNAYCLIEILSLESFSKSMVDCCYLWSPPSRWSNANKISWAWNTLKVYQISYIYFLYIITCQIC